MKRFYPRHLLVILAFSSLTSCNNLSSEVENKLNELKSKTESLDSLINKEVDKVTSLDSIINGESEKVKQLDSLIHKKASAIDSFSRDKVRQLEKIIK